MAELLRLSGMRVGNACKIVALSLDKVGWRTPRNEPDQKQGGRISQETVEEWRKQALVSETSPSRRREKRRRQFNPKFCEAYLRNVRRYAGATPDEQRKAAADLGIKLSLYALGGRFLRAR